MQFTEKKERNQYGMKMDVSELLLEHQQNHAQLTLVKGQIATSPQSVATFVYSWGGRKEFQVRKDQEFPLATAEGNRTYKLIDVRPDKAVIVNTQKPGTPSRSASPRPKRRFNHGFETRSLTHVSSPLPSRLCLLRR